MNARQTESLYDECVRSAYSAARCVLGDDPSAQQAVVAAFVHANEGAEPPTAEALVAACHREAVTIARQRRAHGHSWPCFRPSGSGATDPVAAGLRSLPAAQCEAMELSFFGGYTPQEVATQTGRVLADVQRDLMAGMRSLSEYLSRPGSEGPLVAPVWRAPVRRSRSPRSQ